MSETAIEGTSPARTFWPTDYQRFARIVRDVRRDQGDEKADAVAAKVTAAFAADSPDFDEGKFLAGTYTRPAYVGALAKSLRQARHAKCAPTTPKAAEHQDKVSMLAGELAGVLAADVGHGFTAEVFTDSTMLPEPPTYGYDPESDDEDDDV